MPTASQHATSRISTDRSRRYLHLPQLLAAAWLLIALAPAAIGQPADSTSRQARQEQQEQEQHRIDYLIASVAALKDASFIRNGQAYDALHAASHMRLKLRFAGSRVKTAEDFIRYCGTASSTSGTRYTIRFADGHSVDSASFLQQKLAQYRPTPAPGAD
jgi:hypothetical protein